MLSAGLARLALRCPLPRLAPSTALAATIHSSAVVERARQSTRIKKRKVYETNKKKKEERLRKNPPPIPKKVQLMLIAKGLGKEPRPWRRKDAKPFPTDDVWAEGQWHTWPRFPLDEAVAMLREHHHPTMLNQPDALLWAKLEFNLQASKKEKYLDGYSVMVPILHPFERGVAEKAVLVFARDPEAVRAAEAAGAARVGGLELVDDIAKGKIDVADIDHFLAHEDIELKELKPLLGVLREKMPSKLTGTVGTDLEKMVGCHQLFSSPLLFCPRLKPLVTGCWRAW
jgi:large subunit ribosomal protein L1